MRKQDQLLGYTHVTAMTSDVGKETITSLQRFWECV